MTIKLRTLVRHPSRIEGSSGIGVTTANGVVTVALDLASFVPAVSIADQDATTVLLVTPGFGESDPDLVARMAIGDLLALAANFDAELAAIAGLASAANKLPYFTGAGTAALADLSAFGRTLIDDANAAAALGTLGVSPYAQGLLDDADAAAALSTLGVSAFAQTLLDDTSATAARATLGLVIGTDVQAQDAELAAIAGLASAANKLPYFTGAGAAALTDLSAFGRSLIDDADANAARATLGLVIGTNVQAQDAELAAIAGLASAADKAPYFTGAGSAALADLSSFGRSLIDDANATAARTTLGVVIGADVQAFNARLADIAGVTWNQGDILYYNGSNLVDLGPGTNGQFLKTQGAGANPVWAAVPGGGDMLAANNLSEVNNFTTSRNNIHAALRGQLWGLSTGNNGTDADHDIDIAVGEAASDDSSAPRLMPLASAITKRIDANWAVGTNQGGLDTGSVANNTWYYLWLIQRSDTGVVDVLFSTSATSPTMPANYDHKRLIGAVRTNGSANILAYFQVGDTFIWATEITDVSAVAVTSPTSYTLSVPPILGVTAIVNFFLFNPSATGAARVFSGLLTGGPNIVSTQVAGGFGAGQAQILVNGSGQIKAYNSVGTNQLTIYTIGFKFPY